MGEMPQIKGAGEIRLVEPNEQIMIAGKMLRWRPYSLDKLPPTKLMTMKPNDMLHAALLHSGQKNFAAAKK